MANELKMEVKQAILGLAQQGFYQRHIARYLGVHRKTVKRLLEEHPGSEGSKCARVTTGNRSPTQSMCDPFRESIEAKLELGLDAKRIHRDLQSEHALVGSYNSVQRFVKSLKQSSPKRVWCMEVEPGEESQIDYGTMTIVEGEDGRLKRAQLLRVTLSHSRKSFTNLISNGKPKLRNSQQKISRVRSSSISMRSTLHLDATPP